MNLTEFRNTLGAEEAEALVAVHERCRAVDGTDPRSLLEHRPDLAWYRQELASSNPADWVVAVQGGVIVGYGHTLWDWAERDGTHCLLQVGWVSPESRGIGIGSELLARLERRCREKAAQIPAGRYEYGANASGIEVSGCAHLTANGYWPGFRLWEMERGDSAVPHLTLPSKYELRPVLPEHHRAIWQCIGDACDVSRPGLRFQTVPSEDSFTSYFTGDSADPSLWFVA